MNHEELLKVIDEVGYCVENGHTLLRTEITDLIKALRAIVELHKPQRYRTPLYQKTGCLVCEVPDYPCLTIQAIEAALQ